MNLGATEDYRPGQCNIGWKERRLRFIIGIVGILGTAAYITTIRVMNFPTWYLLGSLVFFYTGIVGFLQYATGFCVTLGISGKRHFEEKERVNRKSDRLHDQVRAFQLGIYSLILAIIATGVVFFLFSWVL